MKREQSINYLLHPEQLSSENALELAGLLKEFPYFQSAQLLYLKTLHYENSIHYQSQLKIAAAYSANRKSLYFLINGTPTKVENKQTQTTSSSIETAASKATIEAVKPDEKTNISIPDEVIYEEILLNESSTGSKKIEIVAKEAVGGSKSETNESDKNKAATNDAMLATTSPHESFSNMAALVVWIMSSSIWKFLMRDDDFTNTQASYRFFLRLDHGSSPSLSGCLVTHRIRSRPAHAQFPTLSPLLLLWHHSSGRPTPYGYTTPCNLPRRRSIGHAW